LDRATAIASVVLAVVAALLTRGESAADMFVAVMAALTLGAAVIAANHAIVRRPRLRVEYRNPRFGNRAVVGRDGNSGWSGISVVVRNEGRGAAEAVEVRFDRLGASNVFNESGNFSQFVDDNVHPPRFTSGGRVLNGRQEWVMAQLRWYYDARPSSRGSWEAWAKGTGRFSGEVELVEVVDEGPQFSPSTPSEPTEGAQS
jgi:hypothetical protein